MTDKELKYRMAGLMGDFSRLMQDCKSDTERLEAARQLAKHAEYHIARSKQMIDDSTPNWRIIKTYPRIDNNSKPK